MKRLLGMFVIAAAVAGCGGGEKAQQQTQAPAAGPPAGAVRPASSAVRPASDAVAALPETEAPAGVQQAPLPPAARAANLSGTIAESFSSGGYTYMRLKTPAGEEWVAVRQTEVKKGQQVGVAAQMTMEKFHSSSLNRTFDRIVFGELAGGAPGAVQASAMGMPPPVTRAPMGTPKDHMKVTQAPVDVQVAKAEGPDAMTVAEVWAGRTSLGGRNVVVRGTVVKSLNDIMGKNWLHVRDGSGSAAAGDNDLTVTTSETARVGDVVVVRGVVRIDKDFGAGYVYPVILEEAKIQ